MVPLRGEVWWVDLDPTIGSEIRKTRPCVVMSDDPLNQRRRTVVVIPLSTAPTVRPPLTIAVRCAGMSGVAVVDQIRAAAKERFTKRLGSLSSAEMVELGEAVKTILAIAY